MSDFEKSINASDLIDWIMCAFPDWCVGDVRAIVDHVNEMPSAQPEIIRCRDCKWWGYDDDTGDVRVCHAAKHGHISSHWEITIRRTYRGDFYCADAERRTDGTEQP